MKLSILSIFFLILFASCTPGDIVAPCEPIQHQVVTVNLGQSYIFGYYTPSKPLILGYKGISSSGFPLITYPGKDGIETAEIYQGGKLVCYNKHEQWIRLYYVSNTSVTIEINALEFKEQL